MDFKTAVEKHFRFKHGRPGGVSYPIPVMGRHRNRRRLAAGVLSLAEMSRDMEARAGVEIGTYLGNSAIVWCKTNPQLHLTCIDPYRPYGAKASAEQQEESYQSAVKALAAYDATIVRKASMEVVDGFKDGSLDFLFIDGDHHFDAVVQDLVRWVPKVRKGGLVLLHDYTAYQGPHVIMAVNAYTHCHNIAPWYVTMDASPMAFWEM